MTLRKRVALELLTLALLAVCFLVLFPSRTVLIDFVLACFALLLVGLNARYTRGVIWDQWPIPEGRDRWRQSLATTGAITLAGLVVLLILGSGFAYESGDWVAVVDRILNPGLVLAATLYLPWAFVQQVLCQFYLLGRLRTLLPAAPLPLLAAVNGFTFALVHLPDVVSVVGAALGGTAWSMVYLRYRVLLPLAASHALLGSALYYWLLGRDLVAEWGAALGGL